MLAQHTIDAPEAGNLPATIAVTLTNRKASFYANSAVQAELKKFFRYRMPGYRFAPKYKEGREAIAWAESQIARASTPEDSRKAVARYEEAKNNAWDGYLNLMRWGQVATGLFLVKQKEIEGTLGVKFEVRDHRSPPLFVDVSFATARSNQLECVAAMIDASSTGGLVIMATGVGKTGAAAMYCARLQGSVCFVVDELSLLFQAQQEIASWIEEPVGVVGMGEFQPKRITVATIQTLFKHSARADFKNWMRTIDVFILDEVHLALNRRHLDVIHLAKPKAVFGLTATLEIEKQEIFLRAVELCGPVIHRYTIQQGMEDKVLNRGSVIQVPYKMPMVPEAEEANYTKRIVLAKGRNDLVEKLARKALAEGRTVAILAERRIHLSILSRRFTDTPHRILSGDVSAEERIAAKEALEGEQVHLLIASRVFYKGVDLKCLDTIIDATGRRSANDGVQRFGRGVRTYEGKLDLLYLDVTDKGSADNPFARAARSRKRAFTKIGIAVSTEKWL